MNAATPTKSWSTTTKKVDNPDYYIRYMQLVTKYAKPYANIINSVVGLLMSFKAAFENFGFIAKGFDEEAKKLEAEFSTKKD